MKLMFSAILLRSLIPIGVTEPDRCLLIQFEAFLDEIFDHTMLTVLLDYIR